MSKTKGDVWQNVHAALFHTMSKLNGDHEHEYDNILNEFPSAEVWTETLYTTTQIINHLLVQTYS